MTKYLLDTCIIIWILEDDQKNLSKFMEILTDSKNTFFVSLASYWEMAIQNSIGKLNIPDNMISKVEESGIQWLNIQLEHLDQVRKLPPIHNDPFDRLIVAQAQLEGMKILTRDPRLSIYNQLFTK